MGKVQEFMDENGKGFKNNEIRSQILRKVRLHTERNIVIRKSDELFFMTMKRIYSEVTFL